MDHRRKIRLIKGNAKCRQPAGVYLPEAQSPFPPPLHTVYVYTVYLFTQRRGRVKPEQFTKLGRKYQLTVSLVYKL